MTRLLEEPLLWSGVVEWFERGFEINDGSRGLKIVFYSHQASLSG